VIEKNKDTVKLVIKNYPLAMHKFSRNAAAAAVTADSMGKFWEFHDALYKNGKQLNDEKIREIASGLGLNPDKFEKKMKSKNTQDQVNQDKRDGEKAGVRGTPAVFINGKLVRDRSLKGFQNIIDAQLAKKK
jgi:protein-disulfide isomerase